MVINLDEIVEETLEKERKERLEIEDCEKKVDEHLIRYKNLGEELLRKEQIYIPFEKPIGPKIAFELIKKYRKANPNFNIILEKCPEPLSLSSLGIYFSIQEGRIK